MKKEKITIDELLTKVPNKYEKLQKKNSLKENQNQK